MVLFTACAAGNKPTGGGGGGDAKAKSKTAEDLSAYRPKFETPEPAAEAPVMAAIIPTEHNNQQVAVLMDTLAAVNKNIKYAQGFRILAYTGTDKNTVMNIRRSIINRMPDERDYLTYKQPTYRLKIGDYLSRVEAQQALQQIRDIVPNAMIMAEQININRPTE